MFLCAIILMQNLQFVFFIPALYHLQLLITNPLAVREYSQCKEFIKNKKITDKSFTLLPENYLYEKIYCKLFLSVPVRAANNFYGFFLQER